MEWIETDVSYWVVHWVITPVDEEGDEDADRMEAEGDLDGWIFLAEEDAEAFVADQIRKRAEKNRGDIPEGDWWKLHEALGSGRVSDAGEEDEQSGIDIWTDIVSEHFNQREDINITQSPVMQRR